MRDGTLGTGFVCRLGLVLGLVMTVSIARADSVALWTFELPNIPPAEANVANSSSTNATSGTGSAKGVHSRAATDYTNPTGNGSGESFGANEWVTGDYYQFQFATTGFENIALAWDQTRSGTGPQTFEVTASTDGTTFTSVLASFTVLDDTAAGGGTWSTGARRVLYTLTTTLGAAYADKATVYVRLVSKVTATNNLGTARVDNFEVTGTPVSLTAPILYVIKDDDVADFVVPGETFNYEILIGHDFASSATASTVVLTDQLPSGLTIPAAPDNVIGIEPALNGKFFPTLDLNDADMDGAGISASGLITVNLGTMAYIGSPSTSDNYAIFFGVVVGETAPPTITNAAKVTYVGETIGKTGTVQTVVVECTAPADCDDLNPCTTDTCSLTGTCLNTTVTCTDSKSCTTDVCDPGTGLCVSTANTSLCNDGATCSSEVCDPNNVNANATTGCVVTKDDLGCSDGRTCSTETCSPGTQGANGTTGCLVTPNNGACSDGKSCTTDVCSPTTQGADGTTGCIATPNNANCSDGVACTTDTCSPATGGADPTTGCVATPNAGLCNDAKSCTTDACDPTNVNANAQGCVITPMNAGCSDGKSCTTDTCEPSANGANGTTGCVSAKVDALCGDSKSCTTDTCDPTANGANGTTGCLITPVNAACNDGKTCTSDVCNPSGNGADGTTGCVASPVDAACADGLSCTLNLCAPGTAGANATSGCTIDFDNGACSDGITCTNDICDPSAVGHSLTTGCIAQADNSKCDDGVACTVDTCQPGAGANGTTGCLGTPNNGSCASDNNPCTNEVCHAVTGCTPENNTASCTGTNGCLSGDRCAGGSCVEGTTPLDCNDNVASTADTCAANVCVNTPIVCATQPTQCQEASFNGTTCAIVAKANNIGCDDGLATTSGDKCAAGVCSGTTIVCAAPTQCQESLTPNGTDCTLVNKGASATCDDGLATTSGDKCNGSGACAGTTIVCAAPTQCETAGVPNGTDCPKGFKDNATTCNDSLATTADDKCNGAGACVGTTIACPTPTDCQTAGVPNGTTCVTGNRPDTATCNDGEATTKTDKCDGKGACVGVGIQCQADTACGTYEPNGVDCTLKFKTGACDDGLATTHDDACADGVCKGTGYACAPSQCELTSVANGDDCTTTNKGDDAPCNDGLATTKNDRCDGSGGCAGTPYTCTPAICEATSVADGSDCIATPATPGSDCDDLDPCTSDDSCDGRGACIGTPIDCGVGESCDLAGACQVTHCKVCGDSAECGEGSDCLAAGGDNRCLLSCDNDDDCGLNQACRRHGEGTLRCFDLNGTCAAPAVDPDTDPETDPEVVESVEVVEPAPEEVEPQPEAVEPEVGPEAAETEPTAEVVETTPEDTSLGGDAELTVTTGGSDGCAGAESSAALMLLGLAIVATRRKAR